MKKNNTTKRTIKFLAICKDKQLLNSVLRRAPDSVIKKLCDIALNALKGDVQLSASQRKLFRKNRRKITKVVDRSVPLDKKRVILQDGGFAWIPAIIGAVVSALGSTIFGGASKQS